MRTASGKGYEERVDLAEASLARRMDALFSRCPMLTGFSVQEEATLGKDRNAEVLEGRLCIADVSVEFWPGLAATEVLCKEIAETLAELIYERPETYELLRGRTFARTLH
jgi:hypothetical protein